MSVKRCVNQGYEFGSCSMEALVDHSLFIVRECLSVLHVVIKGIAIHRFIFH